MPEKLFHNGYGYFNESGDEYVITRPDTPCPWVNVISNGIYGLIISQAGSGYSWREHATLNRITRWEQDLIKDQWGKYLYLRDNATGRYWSVCWQPVRRQPERYQCRHGLGYTIISSLQEGIEASATFFVPVDDPLEIWIVRLRNLSSSTRHLSLFTYLEWLLGVAPDWHREFHKCFFETEFQESLGGMIVRKHLWDLPGSQWNRSWGYVAFLTSSPPPGGFDCDKEAFLGRYPYGSLVSPRAVVEGSNLQSMGRGVDAVGCLRVDIELAPGEEKGVVFRLGAVEEPVEAGRLTAKYGDLQAAETALTTARCFWRELLSPLQVKTPDLAFDILNNWWLKYQAISGRLWGRTGYYQPGGAFGFRDQLQDSQVFLLINRPELTLKQIRLHARHQYRSGTVQHWWHPLSEMGAVTESSDDVLWLPFVFIAYLKETADFSALDVVEPYLDGGEGTLYEHCVRAINYVLSKLSPRGIPLIRGGDWNDGMNATGLQNKGESIWLGHLLHWILVEFAYLATKKGDWELGTRYRTQADRLKEALNRHGWDGEWYIRATDDRGTVLGSKTSSEGKIFLNPQTWAVLAGVAPPERARTAMDSVERLLEWDYGPLLFWPPYTRVIPSIGYLTRYAPGTRENGGVYTHAATWAILAECQLRHAEAAYRLYCKINPIRRGQDPELYRVEPYVTSGSVNGPHSLHPGQGGWTWYTGSATWLLKAGIEGILGLRPTYAGLVIDPCMPPEWEKVKVRRHFREAVYEIEIENPHHTGQGIAGVWVDGNPQEDNLIPAFADGGVHKIRVILGPTKKKPHAY